MKKVYKYENGIVEITHPTAENMTIIRKATEDFLRKIVKMEEEIKRGNQYPSKVIRKK